MCRYRYIRVDTMNLNITINKFLELRAHLLREEEFEFADFVRSYLFDRYAVRVEDKVRKFNHGKGKDTSVKVQEWFSELYAGRVI